MIKNRSNNAPFFLILLIFLILLMCSYLGNIMYLRNQQIQFSNSSEQTISTENRMEIERIDRKYCNGPCRFLSLYRMPEQETRAQMHVRHFAFTSGLLNRTLVLPNVGNSRIGSCLSHNFEYYYDIQWAKNNSHSFKYITMDEFKSWLMERQQFGVPASDQMISIHDAKHEPNPVSTDKHANCFQDYTVPKSLFNRAVAWNTKSGHFNTTCNILNSNW